MSYYKLQNYKKKLVLSHKESIIANIIGVFKQLFRRETLNLQELLMRRGGVKTFM